jgi:multiple sugar transport system substrate-binding protein
VLPRRTLLLATLGALSTGAGLLSACGSSTASTATTVPTSHTSAAALSRNSASAAKAAPTAGTQQSVLQGKATGARTQVTINYYGARTYDTVMHAVGTGFLQVHPNVDLQLNYVTGNWKQQVETMIAGGVPPDLFRADPVDFYSFAGLGVYEPLDPYVARDNYSFADYWPQLKEEYSWNGKLLNLPDIVNNLILWYNVDLFQKAGLPTPNDLAAKQQWTWDTALQTAQKLTSGTGPTKQFGLYILNGAVNYLLPWVWMAGGSLFDNEQQPTKLTFANPKSVNALQWLGDLGSKYGVEPQPASLVSSNGGQLFYTGRVGMYIAQLDIEGMHSSIKGFSWDCAPLPSGSAGMWNFYGGADFGIVTAAKQHDLGWELLKYITSPAGQASYVTHQLAIPILRSVANADAWLKAPYSPPHKQVILDALTQSKPIPKTSAYTQLDSQAVEPNLADLWNGKANAQTVAAKIDQAGQPILASARR